MAELVIALLSPIATHVGKYIIKKIKERADQAKIEIEVESPNYNGTANHWVEYLFNRIEQEHEESEYEQGLKYAYLGDSISSSIEKDTDVSTLKFEAPNMDKGAMADLLAKQQWKSENDPTHGNAVFSFALPQITYAQLEDESNQITYEDLTSVPLNGKYLFDTKLQSTDFGSYDPGDFYRKGGRFEIPVYLDSPQSDYKVYPVTPPAPTIPEYAIQTKIRKSEDQNIERNEEIFVYCPFCGAKMMKKADLSYCPVCGKDIHEHIDF
ncbi:MAG: hypothetical protein GF383_02290 [Candidatus Lokiarchaeota archaeon]|nr:hypothetical protein [Candidatus Lokiarchaeota archaeon]